MRATGVLLLLLLLGCSQPCRLPEGDVAELRARLALPPDLDCAVPPPPALPSTATPPATVAHPEREPHYLTLNEAIARALEQGTVGAQSLRVPGGATEELVSFTGFGVVGSDSVRVLALEPAIAGARVEGALSRFDAILTSSLLWSLTDEPTQGLSSFSNGQSAQFRTTLAKPLPTGGVTGVSFRTDYNYLTDPPGGSFGVLNPSYVTRLNFGFEQPLLRDAGVEMNQLLPTLPFSNLFPEVSGRRPGLPPEGILIARLRFDQQRAELARVAHYQLLNVEAAYWNLYGAYVSLYATDQSLRQAHEAWRITKAQFESGAVDRVQFAQVRAQFELFRGERLQAVGRVIDLERTLRVLLGMPVEDGCRLVPIDAPTLAPHTPDWACALRDALTLRPELVLAREDVKAKQFALKAQQNFLRPDLRFQANYELVGLGSRLDGNNQIVNAGGDVTTDNSLRSLASGRNANWTAGLSLYVPVGFRLEHSAVRQARLELAQSYHLLKDQENKAQVALARQYSGLVEAAKLVESRRLYRQQLSQVLELLYQKFAAGKITATDPTEGISLLEIQRQWAAALSAEYQAIVDYNNALARFEFARGTILDHHNVVIAEGALPACAQVRAVEHERHRAPRLVRERRCPTGAAGDCPAPPWPHQAPPSVAALWPGAPPVTEQPDLATPPAPTLAAAEPRARLLPPPQFPVIAPARLGRPRVAE
jgi:outer membrane protein TolC